MTRGMINVMVAITTMFAIVAVVVGISRSSANAQQSEDSHYVAQYNSSGEMLLPPNNVWRNMDLCRIPIDSKCSE